jgi:hypothetical protein
MAQSSLSLMKRAYALRDAGLVPTDMNLQPGALNTSDPALDRQDGVEHVRQNAEVLEGDSG